MRAQINMTVPVFDRYDIKFHFVCMRAMSATFERPCNPEVDKRMFVPGEMAIVTDTGDLRVYKDENTPMGEYLDYQGGNVSYVMRARSLSFSNDYPYVIPRSFTLAALKNAARFTEYELIHCHDLDWLFFRHADDRAHVLRPVRFSYDIPERIPRRLVGTRPLDD